MLIVVDGNLSALAIGRIGCFLSNAGDANGGDAGIDKAEAFGAASCEVNHAAMDEGAAVIDAHDD